MKKSIEQLKFTLVLCNALYGPPNYRNELGGIGTTNTLGGITLQSTSVCYFTDYSTSVVDFQHNLITIG